MRNFSACFIFTLLISSNLFSQNLIADGGFEIGECPKTAFNTNNSAGAKLIDNWWTPTAGSSDYFRVCNGVTKWVNTPFGKVTPAEGKACAGFIASNGIPNPKYVNTASDYAEYVQSKLNSPLVAGGVYIVSYKIRLSESSKLQCNGVGFHLGEGQIKSKKYAIYPKGAVYSNEVFKSHEWTQMTYEYVAKGGEEFLTIGRFKGGDSLIVKAGKSKKKVNFSQAYFLLDDVEVRDKLLADSSLVINRKVGVCNGKMDYKSKRKKKKKMQADIVHLNKDFTWDYLEMSDVVKKLVDQEQLKCYLTGRERDYKKLKVILIRKGVKEDQIIFKKVNKELLYKFSFE